MQIDEHRIVTITYDLRDGSPEGSLLERMNALYPFIFYFGSGQLLPAFEEQLQGLSEGDGFSFILLPGEAYGPVRSDLIVDVPRPQIEALGDHVLIKDNFVALTDDLGVQHNGKILSWDERNVQVDLNHAMAGKTLYFKGAVLNVREATLDELIRKSPILKDGFKS